MYDPNEARKSYSDLFKAAEKAILLVVVYYFYQKFLQQNIESVHKTVSTSQDCCHPCEGRDLSSSRHSVNFGMDPCLRRMTQLMMVTQFYGHSLYFKSFRHPARFLSKRMILIPPPDQLVLKEETVKVTLALTKKSVDFFKKIAKGKHTHYQTMIRVLLEQYTEYYRT